MNKSNASDAILRASRSEMFCIHIAEAFRAH